jgi:hypothetical protein
MLEDYKQFKEKFKRYRENTIYNDLSEQEITFDISMIQLTNVTNMQEIMHEMNEISSRIFVYGSVCDAQNKILQQLEDEFDMWKSTKIVESKLDDKQYKSDKAKERYLIVQYSSDYVNYLNKISNEKYKLSLLKRVVSSLEHYAYKLHAIKDYNMAVEKNS